MSVIQLFLVRDLRECFDRLPGGGLIRANALYEQIEPGALFCWSYLHMGSSDVGMERNQTASGTIPGILASWFPGVNEFRIITKFPGFLGFNFTKLRYWHGGGMTLVDDRVQKT